MTWNRDMSQVPTDGTWVFLMVEDRPYVGYYRKMQRIENGAVVYADENWAVNGMWFAPGKRIEPQAWASIPPFEGQ